MTAIGRGALRNRPELRDVPKWIRTRSTPKRIGMTAMSTTHDAYTLLSSLSDLEARLFCAPIGQAANTSAFVEQSVRGGRVRAANVRSLVPDPPKSSGRAGIIESVLLRAV